MGRRGIAIAALLIVLTVGLVLNFTGVVPIEGGPVGADAVMPDGNFSLATYPASRVGDHVTLYTTLFLDSIWSVAPTLLSVTPLGASANARVTIIGTTSIEGSSNQAIGSAWDPGPGWRSPDPIAGTVIPVRGNVQYRLVLVGISATSSADASVRGFQIDYAIGPFRFRSVDQTAILVCAATGTTSGYPKYCEQ